MLSLPDRNTKTAPGKPKLLFLSEVPEGHGSQGLGKVSSFWKMTNDKFRRQPEPLYLSFIIDHLSVVIFEAGAGLETLELLSLSAKRPRPAAATLPVPLSQFDLGSMRDFMEVVTL